jgi:hypothetical protein
MSKVGGGGFAVWMNLSAAARSEFPSAAPSPFNLDELREPLAGGGAGPLRFLFFTGLLAPFFLASCEDPPAEVAKIAVEDDDGNRPRLWRTKLLRLMLSSRACSYADFNSVSEVRGKAEGSSEGRSAELLSARGVALLSSTTPLLFPAAVLLLSSTTALLSSAALVDLSMASCIAARSSKRPFMLDEEGVRERCCTVGWWCKVTACVGYIYIYIYMA